MDVRFGRPDSQPDPELNAPAIPTPHHAVPDQKPTRSPRPRSRLQPAPTWRLEPVIAGFDFEKREPIPRDTIWTHPRTGSRWWNRVGKIPRRAETSEAVVPFHSSEASPSELQQVSTTSASDNPTGERLYVSVTEEGPSGDYKMTMHRDRHGRWMPTKRERTMNIQKAREKRRSFSVGESKEYGTFSIASAEARREREISSPLVSALEGDRHRIQGQGQMVRARF